MKRKILFVYDYFHPSYKAGGPVQSLLNLASFLSNNFDIYVFTGCRDLNDRNILDGIVLNRWIKVNLPNSMTSVGVFYSDNPLYSQGSFIKAFDEVKPDFIYLNGIFSPFFFLFPLLLKRKSNIVVCPRGMLQEGALSIRPIKKRAYIILLRILGFPGKVIWHATDEIEKRDIQRVFNNAKKVILAPNIPLLPWDKMTICEKKPGSLRLVYFSLISEKKNLLRVLNLIQKLNNTDITLDIYGPVKDKDYWVRCLKLIAANPALFNYKGSVKHDAVYSVLSGYHGLILLTKGENFGHSIYESLASGRPVITSFFTPWKFPDFDNSGWNVDIENEKDVIDTILRFACLNQSEFSLYCMGALNYANRYYFQSMKTCNYDQIFVLNKH